ncbi:hypothetical protein O9X98_04850 [Agrobacterium salinitolerans]|nr:hypothetical protein [Agrobacterium salinitolerans]
MKNIVYDVKARRVISDNPLGSTGFMSWDRLIQMLKDANEIGSDEELRYIKVGERGVECVVGPKP